MFKKGSIRRGARITPTVISPNEYGIATQGCGSTLFRSGPSDRRIGFDMENLYYFEALANVSSSPLRPKNGDASPATRKIANRYTPPHGQLGEPWVAEVPRAGTLQLTG